MPQGFQFDAGTKAADFITSSRSVDMIFGPVGSGKTKAMCIRFMRHAQEQDASPIDGFRHTRFAMVRNTMPDLKRSTIRTWLETFPEETYGRFNYGASMHHTIAYGWPGGGVKTEFDFISLDKPEDVKKLRSTEYTGIGFNELPFMEKGLFDEADSRLRFPPAEHCPADAFGNRDPRWRGLLADGNAPEPDHWLATMAYGLEAPPGISEDDLKLYEWPSGWGLHMQPPALIERFDQLGRVVGYDVNPAAENLKNLPSDYYQRQLTSKTKGWIDSRLMNRVALVVDGQPVWPMFRREFHVAREALKPVPGRTVEIWLDFGRVYPAALFAQEVAGRIYIQYEILGFNEPTHVFAPKVKRFLATHYAGCDFRAVGDPKGQDGGRQIDRSDYDIFRENGIPVTPAPCPTNDIKMRTEAVAYALDDNPSGINSLVFSPLCRTLIAGMTGKYHLVEEEKGVFKPKKDKYSNLCDCLQYGCLSLGRGRKMMGLRPVGEARPVNLRQRQKTMRRIMA